MSNGRSSATGNRVQWNGGDRLQTLALLALIAVALILLAVAVLNA
jgi:hypothetical protein